MKALTLLLLRISTGLLLVMWGFIKVGAPARAIGVSDKYYSGLISAEGIQTGLGGAEIVLGVLVCLGLLRKIVYPVQAIVLFLGVAFIWNHIADPLGLYLFAEGGNNPLFFPSLCVFFASLIPLAFKDYDSLSLDRKLGLSF